MAQKKYRYNKSAGALNEAMVQQQQQMTAPLSNMMPPEALATAEFSRAQVMADMRRAAVESGGGGDGRDPQRPGIRTTAFWAIVEEGQRVLAVDAQGKAEVIEGPARVWRRGRSFRPMEHYVAHPGEFLVVRYRDGRQEHLEGPAHCWLDPREHLAVEKEEALQITAQEAVVVYSSDGDVVTRRVARGPATFVPAPGEWLHSFSWHGSVGGVKVPNALVFQKLYLLPDQMYHDVAEVRTADDAVLTIRLMIFFRLVDIEKMLENTHDPIGDFVNAATSDVVEFISQQTFEDFKKNAERMNALETYRQLTSRATRSGFAIDKIVYRGYGAPPALQKMHDQATENRTRLQLERATEQQAQELSDFKLERAHARADQERGEAERDFSHRQALEQRQLTAGLKATAARQVAAREQAWLDAEQGRAVRAGEDAREQARLAALAELGVDLTKLLTQGRADRVIEVRGGESTHLHVPPG